MVETGWQGAEGDARELGARHRVCHWVRYFEIVLGRSWSKHRAYSYQLKGVDRVPSGLKPV